LSRTAGKVVCAEGQSEDSIGIFGVAALIGDYEIARNMTIDP